VAPLTRGAARAAREEAGRLRMEARTLKVALRASAAESREQLSTAEAALNGIRARGCEPLPSPWSSLRWTHDDDALTAVLVPIP
jgi:hypothetical protein